MSQHTLGPNWECPGKDGDAWVICAKDAQGKRRTIAHVYQEPNARLIAKAPKMLALLQAFVDMYPPDNHFIGTFDKARTLLREIERETR